MRTTVTLRDELIKALKRRAVESGRSFRAELEEIVNRGLSAVPTKRRFRQRTVSLGGALPGVDLDKAATLAGELEDLETVRKLRRES